MNGVVFDIKEFAVCDGPGIRTTVFMKGCPLRCKWCHNPEGLSPKPQLMISPAACLHCGECEKACEHPDKCVACGKCIPACHAGLRRIVGAEWESKALAERLLKDRAILEASGGGVTFSGGEPLMQWDFVKDTIGNLQGMHTCIETSGYCADSVFEDMMNTIDLIMMDIKLVDADKHKRWTGVGNAPILRHAKMLCEGEKPFIIRLPIIPGVNDNRAHTEKVAALLKDAECLQRAEILPYHQTAGAKYPLVGMKYPMQVDSQTTVSIFTEPLDECGIQWKLL